MAKLVAKRSSDCNETIFCDELFVFNLSSNIVDVIMNDQEVAYSGVQSFSEAFGWLIHFLFSQKKNGETNL